VKIEIYRSALRVFAPNSPEKRCQEMGRGYLRGYLTLMRLIADS